MARRRMIDPHFWESADVNKLDLFSRYILISLFSHADDDGRGIGSAIYIRNVTFPSIVSKACAEAIAVP